MFKIGDKVTANEKLWFGIGTVVGYDYDRFIVKFDTIESKETWYNISNLKNMNDKTSLCMWTKDLEYTDFVIGFRVCVVIDEEKHLGTIKNINRHTVNNRVEMYLIQLDSDDKNNPLWYYPKDVKRIENNS